MSLKWVGATSSDGFLVVSVLRLLLSFEKNQSSNVLTNPNHVLYQLLPQRSTTAHNLRPRRYDRTLLDKQTRLYNSNFIIRILFKDCY